MFTTIPRLVLAWLMASWLICVSFDAQAAGDQNSTHAAPTQTAMDVWTTQFSPGTIRYEFEGFIHISSEHAEDVKLTAPTDCSYQIRAVLQLDFSNSSADGIISGQASFRGVEAQIPECASAGRERVNRALKSIASSGSAFQIFPGGDVRLSYPIVGDEPAALSILRKAIWDALQPEIVDKPLMPGSSWTASRRFLYWPDTFVEDMDIAAATMHYARDVQVGIRDFALIEYRQVFSPNDIPAFTETRSRANDFTGTTFISGRSGVSLLWDKSQKRVVYLHRERDVDNRLMLQYDTRSQARHIASFAIDEESTLRWLPTQDAEPWLAELHRFESSARQPSQNPATTAKRKQVSEPTDISDLVNPPPKGFERWKRQFCTGPYCFEMSLAVPEGTHVIDASGTTVLLAGARDKKAFLVAVGPLLDLQSSGLTSDELLRQQTLRFVNTNLWFGRGAGEPGHFSSESIHDRPAGAAEFTSTSRQLSPTRGRLVMVIGPFGRLVPVACSHEETESDLDATCATITESLILH